MHLRLEKYDSPLSPLFIVTDDEGNLRALEFADHESRMHRLLREHYGEYQLEPGKAPKSIVSALDAFFAGELAAIEDLKVATGGTPFQRNVWRALRKIPAGTTISYGQLAGAIESAQRQPRGGCGQRCESGGDCCAMPSRDRRRWDADRLRWRAGKEAVAHRSRAEARRQSRGRSSQKQDGDAATITIAAGDFLSMAERVSLGKNGASSGGRHQSQ